MATRGLLKDTECPLPCPAPLISTAALGLVQAGGGAERDRVTPVQAGPTGSRAVLQGKN